MLYPQNGDRIVHRLCYVTSLYVSDMELGHWVTGSVGHLGHLSRSGHRVIILTRCETRVFPVFEKMPKLIKTGKPLAHCKRLSHNYGTNIAFPGTMQILLFGAGYKYSYFLTYLVEYSSTLSTEYSSNKKLDSHTSTHKSSQLGPRVAGFPGHWVAGSQNVTQFHV